MTSDWAEKNDLEVVQAFLAKERGASEELGKRLAVVFPQVQQYNRHLERRLAANEVEDLSQKIQLNLIKKLPVYDGTATLSAWASGFVTRHFLKHFTANRKERDRNKRIHDELGEDSEAQMPVGRDTPIADEVRAVLETLKSEDRRLLTLRVYKKWTFPKIAKALGRTEPGTKAKYRRLIIRLRDRLEPYWDKFQNNR